MSDQVSKRSQELETREKQTVERERTRPGPTFRPDVDIVERGDEFVVTADLPGVDEKNVHVRLEEGILSIDAELAVLPDPDWSPIHSEFRLGGYHREFALSDAVDAERIHAAMRDGVLELHLPKSDQHRPRTIQVQAG